MQWQRLDRDNSAHVIDSVKSENNAGLFSLGTSEVERARLPFYKDYALYKVTNYASLPSFSFQYLSDGTFFHYLDGTEAPIYAVNDKKDLNLSEGTIAAYLSFFFEQVGDEDGDIILINNPHDMPLLDSLDPMAYDAVFSQHKPMKIHYDGGFDAYEVTADLYKESQLVRAEIEINMKGRVEIKSQKAIMHGVGNADLTEGMM